MAKVPNRRRHSLIDIHVSSPFRLECPVPKLALRHPNRLSLAQTLRLQFLNPFGEMKRQFFVDRLLDAPGP
jgi:hypothetical protein